MRVRDSTARSRASCPPATAITSYAEDLLVGARHFQRMVDRLAIHWDRHRRTGRESEQMYARGPRVVSLATG